MEANKLTLRRVIKTEAGTGGELYVNGELICCTVERTWHDNKPNLSCIPAGTYPVRKRHSPKMERTWDYPYGWGIEDVPGRKYILFHPGNTTADTNGCILTAEDLSVKTEHGGDFKLFGSWSRSAYNKLDNFLNSCEGEWTLDIVDCV